jgi:hypothetical protein
MKKIITLSFFLITLLTFGQVPQGISYQAIALNTSGNPVVSSNVGIRLSLLNNSATGTVLYTETHTKTTNAQGLFNLVIGQGTPTTGTFSTINWGTNSKFLKVEMDATGGTNYVLVGTTQLLSVPYAMHAGSIDYDNIKNNPKEVNTLSFMTTSNAYVFAPSSTGGTGSFSNNWYSTSIYGTPFMRSYNSFLTSSNAYVFAPSSTGGTGSFSNNWYSTPVSGSPFKIVTSGYYITGIATSSNAYVFAPSSTGGTSSYSNNWYSTPISGTILDIIIANDFVGVLTTTNAYVFGPSSTGGTSSYSNNWYSTPISGTALKIIGSETGNGIMIVTSSNAYVFGPSSTGGTGSYSNNWYSTPISGIPFQN